MTKCITDNITKQMQIGDTVPREMRSGVGSRLRFILSMSACLLTLKKKSIHKYPFIWNIKWCTDTWVPGRFVLLVLPASVSLCVPCDLSYKLNTSVSIQYDRRLTQLLSEDFVECHFSHFSEMFMHHAPNAEI